MRFDTPHTRPTKKSSILLWAVQGLLAALFLFAGAMKLVTPTEQLAAMAPLRQHARSSGMQVVAVSFGLREDLAYPVLFAVVAALAHVAARADGAWSRPLDAAIVGVFTVAAGISSSGGVALGPLDPRARS